MTNAIKVLLQKQSGFLQLVSTIVEETKCQNTGCFLNASTKQDWE
jgi:hypothetical protein